MNLFPVYYLPVFGTAALVLLGWLYCLVHFLVRTSRQQLAVHPPYDIEASRLSHHDDRSSDPGVDVYPESPSTVSNPRTPVQPAADSVPYLKQGSKRFVNEECVICLAEFEDGEVCQVLVNCQHVYHRECINEWMSRSSCCPICRVPAMDIRVSKFGENPIT